MNLNQLVQIVIETQKQQYILSYLNLVEICLNFCYYIFGS